MSITTPSQVCPRQEFNLAMLSSIFGAGRVRFKKNKLFGLWCTVSYVVDCVFFACALHTNRALKPVICVVAFPVDDLLDKTRSEEHLQIDNESMKTQQNKNTKHMPEKYRRRAL